MTAAAHGHTPFVRWLLEAAGSTSDAAAVNKAGRTALHLAASKGRDNVVRALLGVKEVQVDAADNAGCSALHLAAQHGHTTTMRLLLVEGNADSSARDELGGLASRYCDERVWQRLQEERPNRRK
eukprot:4185-Heterococcus_DN1.PRE.1